MRLSRYIVHLLALPIAFALSVPRQNEGVRIVQPHNENIPGDDFPNPAEFGLCGDFNSGSLALDFCDIETEGSWSIVDLGNNELFIRPAEAAATPAGCGRWGCIFSPGDTPDGGPLRLNVDPTIFVKIILSGGGFMVGLPNTNLVWTSFPEVPGEPKRQIFLRPSLQTPNQVFGFA